MNTFDERLAITAVVAAMTLSCGGGGGAPSASEPLGGAAVEPAAAENECSKPQPRTRGAGIEWVRLEGGTFEMGAVDGDADEQPRHPVTLAAFEIARTETTVNQYAPCVEGGRCEPPGRGCTWGNRELGEHPVNCVSWEMAAKFCTWAGGRLPTEAEWEYAARRGGRDQPYPWGSIPPPSCASAVMVEELTGEPGCGEARTWPVCSMPCGNSAQGVCDLAGNVNEWVADWYDKTYYASSPENSPEGPSTGTRG